MRSIYECLNRLIRLIMFQFNTTTSFHTFQLLQSRLTIESKDAKV